MVGDLYVKQKQFRILLVTFLKPISDSLAFLITPRLSRHWTLLPSRAHTHTHAPILTHAHTHARPYPHAQLPHVHVNIMPIEQLSANHPIFHNAVAGVVILAIFMVFIYYGRKTLKRKCRGGGTTPHENVISYDPETGYVARTRTRTHLSSCFGVSSFSQPPQPSIFLLLSVSASHACFNHDTLVYRVRLSLSRQLH